MRISMFLMSALFITHISACIFHYAAMTERNHEKTWIGAVTMQDASQFDRSDGINVHEFSAFRKTMFPAYWIVR